MTDNEIIEVVQSYVTDFLEQLDKEGMIEK